MNLEGALGICDAIIENCGDLDDRDKFPFVDARLDSVVKMLASLTLIVRAQVEEKLGSKKESPQRLASELRPAIEKIHGIIDPDDYARGIRAYDYETEGFGGT